MLYYAECEQICETIHNPPDQSDGLKVVGSRGNAHPRLLAMNLQQQSYLTNEVDIDFFLMAIPTTAVASISGSFLFTHRPARIRHAIFDQQCLQICCEPYHISIPLSSEDMINEITKSSIIRQLDTMADKTVNKATYRNTVTGAHVRIDGAVLAEVLSSLHIDHVLIAQYGMKMRYTRFIQLIGHYACEWPAHWPYCGERNEYDVSRTIRGEANEDEPVYITTFGFDKAVPRRVGLRRQQSKLYGHLGFDSGGIRFSDSTIDHGVGRRVMQSIVYNSGVVSWLRGYDCMPAHTFANNKALAKFFTKMANMVSDQRLCGLNRYRIEVRIRSTYVYEPYRLDIFGLALFYRQDIVMNQFQAETWHESCLRAVQLFRAANIAYGNMNVAPSSRKQQMISSLINLCGWYDAKHPWYAQAPEVNDVVNFNHQARPEVTADDVILRQERIDNQQPYGIAHQDLELSIRRAQIVAERHMHERAQNAYGSAEPLHVHAAPGQQEGEPEADAEAIIQVIRRSIKVRFQVDWVSA